MPLGDGTRSLIHPTITARERRANTDIIVFLSPWSSLPEYERARARRVVVLPCPVPVTCRTARKSDMARWRRNGDVPPSVTYMVPCPLVRTYSSPTTQCPRGTFASRAYNDHCPSRDRCGSSTTVRPWHIVEGRTDGRTDECDAAAGRF